MSVLGDTSIQYMKGVGPARKKVFERLGIYSIEDLLYFFPRRYEDRRNLIPIAQAKLGEWQTISGKVKSVKARKSWHTKKHVLEVVLYDGSGGISCTWFNQPYLTSYFKPDAHVVCYGKVDQYKNALQMIAPEYEVIGDDDANLSLQRIVPLYPLTYGITQRYLRKTIHACLEIYKNSLDDELPIDLRKKHQLADIKSSIEAVHFPEEFKQQEEALRRVSFEEFFFFQISIMLRRMNIIQKAGIQHKIGELFTQNFLHGLPFELTRAQKNAIVDIRKDMQLPRPMLRLLQGDVGSGKTLVALFACYAAVENGYQSAMMAPTEILARQHYENVGQLIQSGVLKGVKPVLLISALKKKERDEILADIASGEANLIIGTHALITEDVQFSKLSLVVIDEQHKFGVRQRALLSKKGTNPDVLIMTATPIPRTLCITLYGDLDVSIIDEMPPGRGDLKTIHFRDENVVKAYDIVRNEVKSGGQVYFVFPLVAESEKLDLKSAEDAYQQFSQKEFKEFRVGLVHGQMKQLETQEVMQKFKNHEIDILVSTTVLEVGIDVANANVMVVEHADRFGLSQLHQLRGRIGRGKKDACFVVIADPTTQEGVMRLDAICATRDGFQIAQKDLEIRGPGHYFGRHQHGLNELKVANPATQLDVLELARKDAIELMETDPLFKDEKARKIKFTISKRYPTYLHDIEAG